MRVSKEENNIFNGDLLLPKDTVKKSWADFHNQEGWLSNEWIQSFSISNGRPFRNHHQKLSEQHKRVCSHAMLDLEKGIDGQVRVGHQEIIVDENDLNISHNMKVSSRLLSFTQQEKHFRLSEIFWKMSVHNNNFLWWDFSFFSSFSLFMRRTELNL